MSWQSMLDRYLSSAVDSENTRRAYRRAIHDAMTAMGVLNLEDVCADKLASYRAALSERDLAPATIKLKVVALRSFLDWSRAMGAHALATDSIKLVLRAPHADVRRPYQVLAEKEIFRVMAADLTPRDRALLAVMLGAGLRVSEVSALRVVDVLEDGDGEILLHVASGKGQRSRTVPVRCDVAQIVRGYLQASGRKMGDEGPLFVAVDPGASRRSTQQLSSRSIAYLVSRAADEAGVVAKRISCHSLRHTYALRALRHTGNVVAVAKLLGHAQLATTQRYVDHLELSELRATVPPLPVKFNVKNRPEIGSDGGRGRGEV